MSMKVLQVINSFATGGAEKLLLETLPLYNSKEIQMDVLMLDGTNYPFLLLLKKINCCAIFHFGLNSLYNPLYIFKLIPFLRKYDVIHVHLFPTLYYVILAKILSFSKVKIVMTEHTTTNNRIQKKYLLFIEKFIYSKFSKIICISNEIDTIMKNYLQFKDKNKFITIENGVNLQNIRNAGKISKDQIATDISIKDKLIIQVAGFREQKDQPTAIKALLNLPSHYKLLLVGDGVCKLANEQLVKKLGLETRVYFLGLRTDVNNLLKTVDYVVLSSNYEGLSLSSIEGLASTKPFLASNVPGLATIVKDAGILFENGDHLALAKEILKLDNDQEYYDATVKSCIKRSQEFDISLMVQKHIALYEELA